MITMNIASPTSSRITLRIVPTPNDSENASPLTRCHDGAMGSRSVVAVGVLLAFTLAGCKNENSTVTADDSTTTGGLTSASSTTTTAAPKPKVVLQPEGLGLAAFGDEKSAVVAALTDALGAADSSGKGCELAGPNVTTTSWKELSIQFSDGKFDSYSVAPGEGKHAVLRLNTEAGIGIGSTKSQLLAAYGSRVTIPGLPEEFGQPNSFDIAFPGSERSISGILAGPADGDGIQEFFTQTCE